MVMQYFDNLNEEKKEYFKILSGYNGNILEELLFYLNDYINLKEFKRINEIGMFCGVDYQKIPLHDVKFWYSRLDHSIACLLMAFKHTNDLETSFTALNHDLGTPTFSHTIDVMLGDSVNQETSEKSIKKIISNSKQIKNSLEKYGINYKDVYTPEKYTIVENKKPKICVDRLDGIFTSGLIWGKFWNLEDIKKFYEDTTILVNENNEKEIGFKNIDIALEFFKGSLKYSMMLQDNTDKMSMSFLGFIVKKAIDKKIISMDDLYAMTEKEIIDKFIDSNDLELLEMWKKYTTLEKVYNSDTYIDGKYCISLEAKKRYVDPLCKVFNKNLRLSKINQEAKHLLDDYLAYSDSKYVYIDYNTDVTKQKVKSYK